MTNSIELRHLRHFIALAEELHFGRAARRCHISQPPFSVSIRQLEESLGFPLVERNRREVRLTPAGSIYYTEATKAVTQVERAGKLADQVHSGLQGSLEIGFFGSMLHRGLDTAIRTFSAEWPDIDVRLVELGTSEQIPALLRHRIQYGFVHSATLPDAVASEELLREPFMLCVSSSHPAAQLSTADLADFSDEPFVLFSRSFSPTYYDQVVSICVAAGFHPNIRHEARYWLTVLTSVSKGMGITLAPRSLRRARLPNLRFIEIGDSPVESVVRSAWLRKESDDPILIAWHGVARKSIAA
jgi:DNA-binding transcriptional LysR family regulator